MPRDMRSFIRTLESDYPDELCCISDGPIDLARGEAIALLQHLMKQNKRPMAIFENTTTLDGKRWAGHVAFQLAGTWTKIAAGYEIPRERLSLLEVEEETARRVGQPIAPMVVSEREAPVKQVLWKEGDFDLFSLPGYIQNQKDAGPGNITGVIIARDPDTGRYNTSWHKNRIIDRERMVTSVDGPRHLGTIIRKYRERGIDRVPVAQVFGHHVLFGLAATIRTGLDIDEYASTGGIVGESVRLAPSTTWGEALMIPADAELVLEGYISTTEQETNGLWGDFFRYYTPLRPMPIMRAVCVNMRENPIFEHTWVGQYVYADVAHCSFLRDYLKRRFAGVGPVNLVGPLTFVIQYHPEQPGDVRRLAAMAHSYGDFVKHVIVVDRDVDPFDLSTVFWSIGARVDASRQVIVADGLTASGIDPSAQEGIRLGQGVGGLVIDATEPRSAHEMEIAQPDPEVVASVDLYRYLSREKVEQLATGHTTRPWASL